MSQYVDCSTLKPCVPYLAVFSALKYFQTGGPVSKYFGGALRFRAALDMNFCPLKVVNVGFYLKPLLKG
jgi:hypothetical protein